MQCQIQQIYDPIKLNLTVQALFIDRPTAYRCLDKVPGCIDLSQTENITQPKKGNITQPKKGNITHPKKRKISHNLKRKISHHLKNNVSKFNTDTT